MAFIGALLLSRLGLSLIIAYILIGMFIGPNISFDLWGLRYSGLISDTGFIDQLAFFGLVLLLFFIGLGFSVNKLRRTKGPAIILALLNLGINMFVGIVIGTYIGWPVMDTIFLAGVISMSSSAITAKSLIDLKKLSSGDAEFLLGVVIVESFAAMFLLTIVHGFVIKSDGPGSILMLFAGVGIFLLFFIWLAVWLIPRVVDHIEKLKSDELFLLFALGMVFLSAALADVLLIPAIIGAFFVGMVFADTSLSERMNRTIAPIRDVFVAIFFISFGMMIAPGMFQNILGMLAIAIPVIIMNDLLITSALAYFLGLTSRGSTFLGASLVGRNVESIFYASVGTNAINNNPGVSHDFGGRYLNPFAGLLCMIMSALTPVFMKGSAGITKFFSKVLPESAKFCGNLVQKTVKTLVLPSYLPLYHKDKRIFYIMVVYFVLIVLLISTGSVLHAILSFLIVPTCYYIWKLLKKVFWHPVRDIKLAGVDASPSSRAQIETLVMGVVVGAFVAMALVAAIWIYVWQLTIFILLGYFFFTVGLMRTTYRRLHVGNPMARFSRTLSAGVDPRLLHEER